MPRLYLLNLRLNICIDNDSSRGSSNSSTCNILSSRRVLIWVGISEAFSLTEMIWFRLNSSWNTVDEIKSRSQEKHVTLSSKFNSLLSHEMSSLFRCSLYHFQSSKLSLRAVLFHEMSFLFQCSLYHFQASKLSLRAVLSLLFLKKSY